MKYTCAGEYPTTSTSLLPSAENRNMYLESNGYCCYLAFYASIWCSCMLF